LVLYFFFLSVTWILLTGCNQSTPTAEPEPVEISFSFFLDNDQTNEASYYENLAEQFSSINPHITVDVTPVNRPALLQYSQADVIRLDLAGFQVLQESGEISTLDPFIEQDVNFDPLDFYPGSVDAFTDGGQIWAIPAGINTYAMYYN
jgi:ABC-type glycerol-3-phosphate transport system substrate-binding protein